MRYRGTFGIIYLMCHIIKIIKVYVDALLVGKNETSELTSLVTEGHYHFLPGSVTALHQEKQCPVVSVDSGAVCTVQSPGSHALWTGFCRLEDDVGVGGVMVALYDRIVMRNTDANNSQNNTELPVLTRHAPYNVRQCEVKNSFIKDFVWLNWTVNAVNRK